MGLHDDDIEEFRRIYHAECHELISPAAAREIASRLLRLYELLAQPLPSACAGGLASHQASATLEGERAPRNPPGQAPRPQHASAPPP